jgi:hypothetical protein
MTSFREHRMPWLVALALVIAIGAVVALLVVYGGGGGGSGGGY